MKVACNKFVLRQTAASEFSHFDGTWEQLIGLVLDFFSKAKPGYRDGVIMVPVPADRFYSPVVQLKEGDVLVSEFKARRPGETPRKGVARLIGGEKTKAEVVMIVLYNHEVLAADNDATTDADWEIVSINAGISEGEPPTPETLMANHFGADGGTATLWGAEEFQHNLQVSYDYWKDKAMRG